METHIQTQADEKQTYMCSQTSNVDACKLKQTKKQSDTCMYTLFFYKNV